MPEKEFKWLGDEFLDGNLPGKYRKNSKNKKEDDFFVVFPVNSKILY